MNRWNWGWVERGGKVSGRASSSGALRASWWLHDARGGGQRLRLVGDAAAQAGADLAARNPPSGSILIPLKTARRLSSHDIRATGAHSAINPQTDNQLPGARSHCAPELRRSGVSAERRWLQFRNMAALCRDAATEKGS